MKFKVAFLLIIVLLVIVAGIFAFRLPSEITMPPMIDDQRSIAQFGYVKIAPGIYRFVDPEYGVVCYRDATGFDCEPIR